MSLQNKIAVVVGGSEGMGYASAALLAQKGATVILLSRNTEKLEKAARQIKKETPHAKVEFYSCNVRNNQQITEVISSILSKHFHIDILLHFAGYNVDYGSLNLMRPSPHEIANMEKIIDTDLLGPIRMLFHIEPLMRQQKNGVIVTMGSTGTLNKKPEEIAYQTAKAGLMQLTEILAKQHELDGVQGVSIYNIAPAYVANPSTHEQLKGKDREEANKEGFLDSREHIAPIVLWLITKKFNCKSGSILRLDHEGTQKIFQEVNEPFPSLKKF